jgi:hypothetical protein
MLRNRFVGLDYFVRGERRYSFSLPSVVNSLHTTRSCSKPALVIASCITKWTENQTKQTRIC